jgi:hypothetical protein
MNKFVLVLDQTGNEGRDMNRWIPQLSQWNRSNPSYLVDASFSLLVCSLNTNSAQGFLKLKFCR